MWLNCSSASSAFFAHSKSSYSAFQIEGKEMNTYAQICSVYAFFRRKWKRREKSIVCYDFVVIKIDWRAKIYGRDSPMSAGLFSIIFRFKYFKSSFQNFPWDSDRCLTVILRKWTATNYAVFSTDRKVVIGFGAFFRKGSWLKKRLERRYFIHMCPQKFKIF